MWPASIIEQTISWAVFTKIANVRENLNQPIYETMRLALLTFKTFGEHFINQPIDAVHWPASLAKIVFGGELLRAIDDVAWTASLERIYVSNGLNEADYKSLWPISVIKFASQ